MAIDDVPAFIARLRTLEGAAARALEFSILTAARSSEVLDVPWSEVDLVRRIWTVPPGRMKGRREHRVPLSDRAIEIVEIMAAARLSDFVFPGSRRNAPLGGMAMPTVLSRMEVDVTVHGFRSTFKDWASERTHFANELSELALAHAIGDKTEAAYRRGDLFEKRRLMMGAWAAFCGSAEGGSRIVSLASRTR